ncbi:MAG TPA: hypothetical protein VH475_01010 [Tepidisphaeraceae bacterium]
MEVTVTTPYGDYRVGSRSAVIVKEVTGVPSQTAAFNACGIIKGSYHPENQSLTCDDWGAENVGPAYYRVTFSYADSSGTDGQTNPLVQPPEIQWDVGIQSERFDRDVYGTAIMNSAGDPFDQPAESSVPVLNFTVTRWEPTPFNVARVLTYVSTTNDGPTTIMGNAFADGQILCTGIAPTGSYRLSAQAIQIAYRFSITTAPSGWDARILDQGMRGWRNAGGRNGGQEQCEILKLGNADRNEPNFQIQQPIRLNGRGLPIDASKYTDGGSVGGFTSGLVENPKAPPSTVKREITSDGLATYLIYRVYRRSNFQSLGL